MLEFNYIICYIAGMILYELHLPLVMLANRALQRGPGSTDGMGPKEIKAYLKVKISFLLNQNCFLQKEWFCSQESLSSLRESLSILGDEPEGSFEWKIVQVLLFISPKKCVSTIRLFNFRVPRSRWSSWPSGWKQFARTSNKKDDWFYMQEINMSQIQAGKLSDLLKSLVSVVKRFFLKNARICFTS